MADILVIDDDANLGLALQMTLRQEGHGCRFVESAEAGWTELQTRLPDLALLDLQLPDLDGLDLLARMRERGLDIPVVVMTAFGTVTTAVTAMKRGAADFIEKPLSVREVCQLVVRLLKSRALARQLTGDTRPADPGGEELALIAECPPMRTVLALANQIAALPTQSGMGLVATLIVGETGTGKEMIARYIHRHSRYSAGPFVQINCTAIPESLFEMEHFGHERGVFTDAKASKQGLLETARGGTLFLDEIGDIPLAMQAKLLVAIETGRFRRVGAITEQQVDMRVVAASNSDLQRKVDAGRFRADLYHRLRMFQIDLPPLRSRGQDILLLADYFRERFARQLDRPAPRLSAEAREALLKYAWPGNVRELGHVLLRVLATCEDDEISSQALGLRSQAADQAEWQVDLSTGPLTLAAVEEKLLRAALARADGNITEAAKLLGMPRGSLRYRLEKLGLA